MQVLHLFILTWVLGCGGADDAPSFRHTRIAPADTTVYIHIQNPARLRDQLIRKPVGEGLGKFIGNLEFIDVWSRLAKQIGWSDAEFFDAVLSDDVTVMIRREDDGGTSWAAVLDAPNQTFAEISRHVRAVKRTPAFGFVIRGIPEHDLLLAHNGHVLAAGPRSHDEVFYAVLETVSSKRVLSLRHDRDIRAAETLTAGDVEIFWRHEPPIGGWSAATALLADDQITVKHVSDFDHSPFGEAQSQGLEIIRALQDSAVVAVARPFAPDASSLWQYVQIMLGPDAVNPEVHANLGDRMLTVVGETATMNQETGERRVIPTLAVGIEVKNAGPAIEHLDTLVLALVERIRKMIGPGTFRMPPIEPNLLPDDHVRRIELECDGTFVLPAFTDRGDLSFNWTTVSTINDAWWIFATHPEQLQDVARALAQPLDEQSGMTLHQSFVRGYRAADLLRSVAPIIRRNTPNAKGDRLDFRLESFSSIGEGIDTIDWKTRRDDSGLTHGDAVIKLQQRSSDNPDQHLPGPSF